MYGTRSALLERYESRPRPQSRPGRLKVVPGPSASEPARAPRVGEVIKRIAFPIVAALAVLAAVASLSTSWAALVLFVAALVVLDVAALTVGLDSRDGLDWRRGSPAALRRRSL
ncbi:MAG: hypothetical protein ACRDLB_06095 [Actinomycetota bacterium]